MKTNTGCPWSLGPQAALHWKQPVIQQRKWLHWPRNTSGNHFLRTRLSIPSTNAAANSIMQRRSHMIQKGCCSLSQSWMEATWKSVMYSNDLYWWLGNLETILQTKEKGNHPPCYQHWVYKPVSLLVWKCLVSTERAVWCFNVISVVKGIYQF